MVVARGWRDGGKWGDVGQRVQSFSYARTNADALIYSMGTTVINTVLYS